MKAKPAKVVVILGMHRSGTSALAGVLSMLGINPGECLMRAQAVVNPKGFWEHAEIVELHEQLLEALDSSWDDVSALPDLWWAKEQLFPFKDRLIGIVQRDFGRSPLWLLKDPRVCRLLPLWLDILQDMKIKPYFVICLRDPYEVAASLQERDGIMGGEACLLWLRHVLDAEQWSRGYPRSLVTYEDVLNDWRSVCGTLEQAMGVRLRGRDAYVIKQIEEFIEPGLRHHIVAEHGKSVGEVVGMAIEVYRLIKSVPLEDARESLSLLSEKVDKWSNVLLPWARETRRLRKNLEELKRHGVWLESELCRIKSTISWRVTKPLRFVAFLLRHVLAVK